MNEEWTNFTMWLKGFLDAHEGKKITPKVKEKIMEKLSQMGTPEWDLSSPKTVPIPGPYVSPQNPKWIIQTGSTSYGTTAIPSLPPTNTSLTQGVKGKNTP